MKRLLLAILTLLAAPAFAAIAPGAGRRQGEGPYTQLILRGVTVINGTGSPAYGPADVVIEGNRIAEIRMVGADIQSIKAADRPRLKAGGREIDLAGHYVIPHWHITAFRVAYWNRFGRPASPPKYELGFESWWIDPAKR